MSSVCNATVIFCITQWRLLAAIVSPTSRSVPLTGSLTGVLPITGYDVTAEFKGGASVPIGRPIANTSCYVLDANLQLQPVGLPGELMVSGVQVCRGYLKHPDLTAKMFIPNPYAAGRPLHDRLYRTGVQPADVTILATLEIGPCGALSSTLQSLFVASP